jgi:hypothetical protein
MHGGTTIRLGKMLSLFASRSNNTIFPLLGSGVSTQLPGVATLVFLGLGFLALAAALRVVFLDWGLPYIYHPDEPVNMATIHKMIADSDFDPHFFQYPSFLFYINLPGQYLVKWLDGALLPFTMQSMGNGFTEQPEAFRAARVTTLLFGLAILPLLIIWARTVPVGVAGLVVLGALFCLNPLLLRHSSFISPNIFAAFFTTSTLLASSLIVLRGDRSSYILAGAMAGLAAASKYNAGLVAVAIPAAHVMRNGIAAAKLRPLVLAAVTTGFVFLMSSPFMVVHPRFTAHEILYQILHYSKAGHPGFEGHSLAANTRWMFDNFGFAGLLAIAACFSPRVRVLLPTVLFIVAYFFLLVIQRVHFDRNLLPLVPAMLLLVAAGVDFISQKVARALPKARPVAGAISGVLALALFARPAMLSLDEVARYDPDPRAEARVWVNALLPKTPARAIAVEAYAPYIAEQRRAVTEVLLALDYDRAALAPFSYLVLSREGSGRFLQGPYDMERANLADLKARSCDYRQFPADTTEPDYSVFAFVCD